MNRETSEIAQRINTEIVPFLYEFYEPRILENVRQGKYFLNVDLMQLAKFNCDLANITLEDPENTIKAFEIAVQTMVVKEIPTFKVRFYNLPKSQQIPIRELRKQHIDKLISIEGTVRQKSDVRPKTKSTRFECPGCNTIIPMLQIHEQFREPSQCTCGRKGKFRILSQELEDVQWMSIEESLDNISGDRAKKIKIVLEGDLVIPLSEKKSIPGTKVRAVGILKIVPLELKNGAKSTQYDLFISVNHIEPKEELFEELNITPEDQEKIKDIAKKKPFVQMVQALLPNVYGYQTIKRALVLQCFGGVRKTREQDSSLRGDIHVLLVGDPGVAKSAMLKRMCEIYPKSRYVVAASATGVGLTGAVVKDEFLKGYTLEAGALSLANKGMCAIDELDKSTDEDRNKLHEAMEQQQITISKANIQEKLPAETTILAAANPKEGRFDLFQANFLSQIDLPSTLKNRFDLIFILKDMPNQEEDRKKANFILSKHIEAIEGKKPTNGNGNPFEDIKFFQKYIAYAKLNCRPKLTIAAKEYIENYFVKLRGYETEEETRFKTIQISARQLEGLVRMSEAFAKTRLSSSVEESDAEFAIQVFEECMKQVAFDNETGKFDVDMISTGVSTSTRNKFVMIEESISEVTKNNPNGMAPHEELMTNLAAKGMTDTHKIEELLSKLSTEGRIYQPRFGFWVVIT